MKQKQLNRIVNIQIVAFLFFCFFLNSSLSSTYPTASRLPQCTNKFNYFLNFMVKIRPLQTEKIKFDNLIKHFRSNKKNYLTACLKLNNQEMNSITLLPFFTTTTFKKQSSKTIDLPSVSKKPLSKASSKYQSTNRLQKSLILTIDRNGGYFLTLKKTRKGNHVAKYYSVKGKKLSILKRAIRRMSRNDKRIRILIKANSASSHQSFVIAMDAIAQLGFKNLSISNSELKK